MQSLNSARDSDVKSVPRSNRLKLWLLLAVCAAPIAASYIAYYVWQPSGHVNYGELLDPRPVPGSPLAALDGGAFSFTSLKGAWVLVVAGNANCDERCRTDLVYLRQMRLALGKESERVQRVWMLTDDGSPPAGLLAEHPGLLVVRARDSEVLRLLTPEAARQIHVVDPLGNLMMRFPDDPDPRRMLKDIGRLLRHSKWK